jgi:hypothetical protein
MADLLVVYFGSTIKAVKIVDTMSECRPPFSRKPRGRDSCNFNEITGTQVCF